MPKRTTSSKPASPAGPELLTLAQAAEYLNVSERTVLRCRYERRLPFVKLGRSLRFKRADLDAFIEAGHHPAKGGDAA